MQHYSLIILLQFFLRRRENILTSICDSIDEYKSLSYNLRNSTDFKKNLRKKRLFELNETLSMQFSIIHQ